jgi:hypothetical protein
MTVEIGAEAALFPEKEYIKGIFVAVWCVGRNRKCSRTHFYSFSAVFIFILEGATFSRTFNAILA